MKVDGLYSMTPTCRVASMDPSVASRFANQGTSQTGLRDTGK
ncbi:hypothetical protein RB3354 [Rhodopirellula baltica SH 1]|uniref:Uncharacterized protein n=1 Tax=Rhodopirellula baltica (strain DSM 10527 / NCIMB 13988 / SH1) TaxID=243090 RepID=Q7UUD8_RHOBA|nr:hypothetical protein RB3354 [Rhodopirellula baltica SH 1]